MKITAAELARMIGATVEGNPDVEITQPAKIEEGGPGGITFLADLAYEHYLYDTSVSAVLVSRTFEPKQPVSPTLLRVDNVRETVLQLLAVYQQDEANRTRREISAHASVEESAELGNNVRVGKFSIVEDGASIGEGTVVLDQVYVGPGVRIGKHCLLYPGVRILRDCVIGDYCVLHANVVIGGDGFGFTPDEDNVYKKVPHVGNVVLRDHVEIGSGSTIDRAMMGSTLIGSGVKLDNLVMIGHNVEVGKNTVIAAQAGIAGSTKVGANCRIGGQVGIVGHAKIADGTQIQAQSGISGSIKEPNTAVFGSPAIPYKDFIRSNAIFRKLPELYRTLTRLEKELSGGKKPEEGKTDAP